MLYDNLLPPSYNENIMTLLVQGPEVIFIYWELSECHWKVVQGHGDCYLRLYRPGEEKNGGNSPDPVEEVCLPPFAGNWYFNNIAPDHDYFCELGFKISGSFLPILKSNIIHTPALPVNEFKPVLKPQKQDRVNNSPGSGANPGAAIKPDELMLSMREVMSTMPFYMGICC